MKVKFVLIFIAACIRPAFAQVTVQDTIVVPAPPADAFVTETKIVKTPEGDIITKSEVPFDATYAQRHLLVLPQDVVEAAEAKEHADVPGQPLRVYKAVRNVVIVDGKELSYITIPVHFEKETDELIDKQSSVALKEAASAILAVLKTQPTAVFEIEGHTSTDGTKGHRLTLSDDRARQVLLELTIRHSVPKAALSPHGYGAMFAKFPYGIEEEMELDHRVLIVRTK